MKYVKRISIIGLLYATNALAALPPSHCYESGLGVENVSGPKYMAQGKAEKFRADLGWSYVFSDVKFSTSEAGYVGTDKSSIDANAYKNITFNSSRGTEYVWAETDVNIGSEGTVKGCSYTEVMVHKKPTFPGSTTFSFNTNTEMFVVSASYAVDSYSQAARESGTNVTAVVRLQHLLYGTTTYVTKQFSATSGNVNLSIRQNAGRGAYSVSLEIRDGNYSSFQGQIVDTPAGYCLPKCF